MRSNAWLVIEWDQNLDKIYDIVTTEHAEDFRIGQKILVICIDHESREYRRYLNFGYGFFAKVTAKRPVVGDENLTIIFAERIKRRWPFRTKLRIHF